MRHVNSCRGDEPPLTCAYCNQSVLFSHMSYPEPIGKKLDTWRVKDKQRTTGSPKYVRFDYTAMEALGMEPNDFLLALTIEQLAHRTGWCFASQSYLARTTHVSTRTLQRQLARLRKAGLIEGSSRLRPTKRFLDAVWEHRKGDRTSDHRRQSVA